MIFFTKTNMISVFFSAFGITSMYPAVSNEKFKLTFLGSFVERSLLCPYVFMVGQFDRFYGNSFSWLMFLVDSREFTSCNTEITTKSSAKRKHFFTHNI